MHTLDLRTGKPVWMALHTPAVPHAPLLRDARTEDVVIGMGISGAMTAEALAAAGFRVTMIDCRGPLLGSTPASTVLVQFEIDELAIRCGKVERTSLLLAGDDLGPSGLRDASPRHTRPPSRAEAAA